MPGNLEFKKSSKLAALLQHSGKKDEEYKIPIYMEKDLDVTKLINPSVNKGKSVILIP